IEIDEHVAAADEIEHSAAGRRRAARQIVAHETYAPAQHRPHGVALAATYAATLEIARGELRRQLLTCFGRVNAGDGGRERHRVDVARVDRSRNVRFLEQHRETVRFLAVAAARTPNAQ